MQIGDDRLGRMGANMVRRLMRDGHECVVYDVNPRAVKALVEEGALGTASLEQFVGQAQKPRVVWLMLPAAIIDETIAELVASCWSRATSSSTAAIPTTTTTSTAPQRSKPKGIHYRRCRHQRRRLGPRARLLPDDRRRDGGRAAPRSDLRGAGARRSMRRSARRARARAAHRAELGYMHCGPSGAGHFVKMVHNGIEYGFMPAYAEGFNILKARQCRQRKPTRPMRRPAPLADPEALSVRHRRARDRRSVASWQRHRLLAARSHGRGAACGSRILSEFGGHVSDSGEGRWTLKAAIDKGVPAPVLSARCTSVSPRAAKPNLPTSFCPRCVTNSAVMLNSRQK